LNESADSIELLPWGKEGVLDLFKLNGKVINQLVEVRDVGDESNGNAKVAVVVLAVKGRDVVALNGEVVELNPCSLLG
jgi:hypothetical protein